MSREHTKNRRHPSYDETRRTPTNQSNSDDSCKLRTMHVQWLLFTVETMSQPCTQKNIHRSCMVVLLKPMKTETGMTGGQRVLPTGRSTDHISIDTVWKTIQIKSQRNFPTATRPCPILVLSSRNRWRKKTHRHYGIMHTKIE